MSSKKSTPYGTILLAVSWLILVVVAVVYFRPSEKAVPTELMGVLRPDPKPLQQFNLVDHNNKPYKLERLKGKWTFMFFGYTFCPDICPTTMTALTATMSQIRNTPGADKDVQVTFVSVDPQRDTPEKLAKYMGYFNKEFIGATGEKAELDALVSQVGAGYVMEPETGPGEYLISHAASIFLMNPDGELVASFSQPHYPATIAHQFSLIKGFD
ncbi:MAG: SCO family protein [Gammaproteobacteria bacterium]|nr:SCO family protein [Gammaproteobacteria bacterium]